MLTTCFPNVTGQHTPRCLHPLRSADSWPCCSAGEATQKPVTGIQHLESHAAVKHTGALLSPSPSAVSKYTPALSLNTLPGNGATCFKLQIPTSCVQQHQHAHRTLRSELEGTWLPQGHSRTQEWLLLGTPCYRATLQSCRSASKPFHANWHTHLPLYMWAPQRVSSNSWQLKSTACHIMMTLARTSD
jgi:hypothetical protein